VIVEIPEVSNGPAVLKISGSLPAADGRGRADDIRLVSAGELPISSSIEHRFVCVKHEREILEEQSILMIL